MAAFFAQISASPDAAWALSLGAYEAIVWLFDPLGFQEKAEPGVRAIQAAAYAGPPLAFALLGRSPRGLGLYFPMALYPFIDTILNAWVPYLFGLRGRGWQVMEAKNERRRAPRVLPPLCGRPPPTLEQTLLLPFVAGTALTCFYKLLALPPDARAAALGGLQISGAVSVFVLAVRVKDEAGRALGASATAAAGAPPQGGAVDGLPFDYTAVLRVVLLLSALVWALVATTTTG